MIAHSNVRHVCNMAYCSVLKIEILWFLIKLCRASFPCNSSDGLSVIFVSFSLGRLASKRWTHRALIDIISNSHKIYWNETKHSICYICVFLHFYLSLSKLFVMLIGLCLVRSFVHSFHSFVCSFARLLGRPIVRSVAVDANSLYFHILIPITNLSRRLVVVAILWSFLLNII